MASANPIGAIVPSMIDLPCMLSSPKAVADLSPVAVEIEFQGAGNFQTTYSWKSCSKCSECYMLWKFDLTLQGHRTESSVVAKISLLETFHSYPTKVLTSKLAEVTRACTEPRMTCNAKGACSEISFEPRR